LLRLAEDSDQPLSEALFGASPHGVANRVLLKIYGRLRKRSSAGLIQDAMKAGLIVPAQPKARGTSSSSPVAKYVCISDQDHSRVLNYVRDVERRSRSGAGGLSRAILVADPAAEDLAVALPPGHAVRISFCGKAGRSGLRDELTHERPEWRLPIDYCVRALEPSSAGAGLGANRNVALLSTAGEKIAWLDDSVDVQFSSLEEYAPASDRAGPLPSADLVVLRGARGRTEDLIARCGDLLGMRPMDLQIPPVGLAVESSWNPDDRWKRYRADSWIATVHFGVVGAAESERTGEHYRQIVGTERPMLVRPPNSVALPASVVDNRVALPPFPPAGRNEGGVFGALLALMYPHAISLELPLAISRRDGYGTHGRGIDVNDVLLFLLGSVNLPDAIAPPDTRLALVGRYLLSFSEMSLATFRDLVFCAAMRASASSRRWEGRALDTVKSATHRSSAATTMPPLSEDFLPSVREALTRFGGLLVEWPGIWRAALSLRVARERAQ
jgi:hypothetical protein